MSKIRNEKKQKWKEIAEKSKESKVKRTGLRRQRKAETNKCYFYVEEEANFIGLAINSFYFSKEQNY